MVTAISIHAKQMMDINMPAFVFRKEWQKHMVLKSAWEGIQYDGPVLLCDDLANSTMSLRKASDICRDYNILKKVSIRDSQ